MAGETVITVVGNLTDDPELRFTPSGAAVANFTVASTPRTLNKQTNEWEDGEAMFLRCSIWRQAAENVAESLQKGARVIVQGRMRARTWETREGEKRTSFEIDVDEIGPSLRWATAKVARAGRSSGGGGGGYGGGQQSGGQADDPWATTPAAPQGGGQPQGGGGAPTGGAPAGGADPWGAPGVGGDEPPF
jgi:single-strand DNA-binding protein